MNKYELNGNIIITTEERYERTFKALGYKPYTEKVLKQNKVEDVEPQKETKRIRKTIKDEE